MPGQNSPHLQRQLGLLEATAANMLEMIGVGPFITIPLILATMNGPQAMLGWLLGALVAICDGLVWAELGAAMPGTGGPYRYLSEAFGPKRLGRLMSFLFIWETVCLAPLSIGAGAVGFAQYTKFLWPHMNWWEGKVVAVGVCALITILLYRDIHSVGRLSIVLWVVVIFTALAVTAAGIANFHLSRVLDFPPHAFTFTKQFFVGLGGATLLAMYDYGGYNNACFFAGEIKRPEYVIPRSILVSILLVGILYLTMNVSIIGVIPWREARHSTFIVSDLMQRVYGSMIAKVMTAFVLFTTFASLFAVLLGYSRVPYAAAVDGRFFSAFGRLHPTRNFPWVSLLFIGITSAVASLLNLSDLITALVVIQVLVQFMAQVVAVTMIRRYRPDIQRPFQMWFYPVTSVIAFAGWAFILAASGMKFILWGIALIAVGIGAYLWRARVQAEWPFTAPEVKTAI
ncbi:MAG TPA: APC family permease [Candidatus Acidoferrum sp.]|nr:APC family permease [Candidatus Acidoferrum sp.]